MDTIHIALIICHPKLPITVHIVVMGYMTEKNTFETWMVNIVMLIVFVTQEI